MALARSLAKDQAEERALAEAKAQADAEATRAAAEQAQRAAAAEARAQARAAWLEQLAGALPVEPAAGTQGCCRIKVKFPDGTLCSRRFPSTATVALLYGWVEVQQLVADDFTLCAGFPTAELVRSESTLESAGLAPSALINVRDNTT